MARHDRVLVRLTSHMCFTTVNVIGDMVTAAIVDRFDGGRLASAQGVCV